MKKRLRQRVTRALNNEILVKSRYFAGLKLHLKGSDAVHLFLILCRRIGALHSTTQDRGIPFVFRKSRWRKRERDIDV